MPKYTLPPALCWAMAQRTTLYPKGDNMRKQIIGTVGVNNLHLPKQTVAAIERNMWEQLKEHEGKHGRFLYSLQVLVDGMMVPDGGMLSITNPENIEEIVAVLFLKTTRIGGGRIARKGDLVLHLRSEWNEHENPL
jgi:hypothetical protein